MWRPIVNHRLQLEAYHANILTHIDHRRVYVFSELRRILLTSQTIDVNERRFVKICMTSKIYIFLGSESSLIDPWESLHKILIRWTILFVFARIIQDSFFWLLKATEIARIPLLSIQLMKALIVAHARVVLRVDLALECSIVICSSVRWEVLSNFILCQITGFSFQKVWIVSF